MTTEMETKSPFQSKTLAGVLIMVLPTIAGWLGFELGTETATEIVNQGALLAGALLAIYGRLKAVKTIR